MPARGPRCPDLPQDEPIGFRQRDRELIYVRGEKFKRDQWFARINELVPQQQPLSREGRIQGSLSDRINHSMQTLPIAE